MPAPESCFYFRKLFQLQEFFAPLRSEEELYSSVQLINDDQKPQKHKI